MTNPYVISAELDLATVNSRQLVNHEGIEGFRESLDANLRAMGKETLWVASSTVRDSLAKAIANTSLPVLSLDDRYVSSADQYLGISRGIDPQLNDDGYVARLGYPALAQQFRNASLLSGEVMLMDDVLFSGEMIAWLSNSLKRYGIKIGAVVVGVAIQEGIDKLAAEDIEVDALEVFDEVEDEICERDFAVIAGSGRRIDALQKNALYFDPENGRPDTWASIPLMSAKSFCISSIERTIGLLQPGVPMEALGRFLGYGTDGDAVTQLTKRLGEMK